MYKAEFEWDENKNWINQEKHGLSFERARLAFSDPFRIIVEDIQHSQTEKRYHCLGKVDEAIITVRFTYRSHKIRIIGAGYWREGKEVYEKNNQIYE